MGLFPCTLAPFIDLLKQVLDVPVPKFRLELVQQLFKRTYRILRDFSHLFLVLEILSDALSDGWRRIDRRQSFNSGLSMLHLHFIDGVALIGDLVLKELHSVLQLMVFLHQALVFILEKDQLLKDIADMLLGRRPCILFKLQIILKPFDFSLQISDDDLIFAVDLGFIVLLAEVDALVELADHGICLAVEIVEIGVFGELDAGSVALGDAVNNGFKVGVVVFGGLDLLAHVFIVGDTIAIYLRTPRMYIPSIRECCYCQSRNNKSHLTCLSASYVLQAKEGIIIAVRSPAKTLSQSYYSVETP